MTFRHLSALMISLVIAVAPNSEASSSNWIYRAWQTEAGLPDNSISEIAQAPDGYLWVGTNGGPMRFNGHEFSSLPLFKIPDLPSRQVKAMLLDRSGNLWLGMERGPVIRVGRNSFRTFDAKDGLTKTTITSIAEDHQGRIWLGNSRAVCRIENDHVTRFEKGYEIARGRNDELVCDADGRMWLAIGGRLCRFDEKGIKQIQGFKGKILRMAASREPGLWFTAGSDLYSISLDEQISKVASLPNSPVVNTIFEDREGAVWIGTQDSGLLRMKDGAIERVETSHPWVNCISQDREGSIWAGTGGGGLNQIKPRQIKLIEETDGMPFSTIRSTTIDRSGRIWAVSHLGELAYRESEKWHRFPISGDTRRVNCVEADSEGQVWVGTHTGKVLRIADGKTKTYNFTSGASGLHVRSILSASNGDLWVATGGNNQLFRLRDGTISKIKQTKDLTAIRALTETVEGTIWIGTSSGQLFEIDGDEMISIQVDDGTGSRSIRSLHSTPDGSLWIGFAGDGMGHLKDGKYTSFTTKSGLYDDYISQILDDGMGSLWIAANRGLFRVSMDELLASSTAEPHKLRCRVFGQNDGLPSIQPSRDYYPTSFRSPEGGLFFATRSGIVEVQPNEKDENAMPPPVILEKVTVDGEVAATYRPRSMFGPNQETSQIDLSLPDPSLLVTPGHNRLVIDFAALSMTSPENTNFRYRLSPLDDHWEGGSRQRSVTYDRLPAGRYGFQVIASNGTGVWNELGAKLDIIVQPFFWETWWFKIGGGFFTAFAAGGLVFLGLRRKHRHLLQQIAAKRALEKERSRIARDIHDDLGARLTRISLLSQSSPDSEEGALDQINTTARQLMRAMDGVVWAIDPEHDTLDDLANYLSSYAQDFLSVAEVRCRIEMPVSLPETPLSAQLRHNLFLAFKEGLNNVVKYAKATEVRISLLPEGSSFVLKIKDNGHGIDPDAPPDPIRPNAGSGLANMNKRMKEIGGTCKIESSPEEGTTVEFSIPLAKINKPNHVT